MYMRVCVKTKKPKQVFMMHFSACPMSHINQSVRLYVQQGSTVGFPTMLLMSSSQFWQTEVGSWPKYVRPRLR